MIRSLKYLLFILVIASVVLVSTMHITLQASLDKNGLALSELQGRKEDLVMQQEKLSRQIQELNASMQDALVTNEQLKQELAIETQNENAIVDTINNPPPPPPAPVTPPKTIITRAS